MSLTPSLTSSVKKQPPPLGTAPLLVPYSIIMCTQHMYSTYMGHIWSDLRSPALLALFKGCRLKQAHFHASSWLSNMFSFELWAPVPSFRWWLWALLYIHLYLYHCCGGARGKTMVLSLCSLQQLDSFALPAKSNYPWPPKQRPFQIWAS